MSSSTPRPLPPDQPERQRALDAERSILVQAPAGSGKTDLLTRRFLRLLAEVEEPGQVVAITFTKSAAAEMRHRILTELEKAAANDTLAPAADAFSMEALAQRALNHSRALGWNLLDLPAQLRISTIDSFCRDLALQQPLLSGLGGGLDIFDQPKELYRRAARQTLRKIDQTGSVFGQAIEDLLLWRDNNWQEVEGLLVEMLSNRDRWMHEFVLEREPDWEALRERLERPFANAVRATLDRLSQLLDQVSGGREEALALARFACAQTGGERHRELAELAEFPAAPLTGSEAVEESREAHAALVHLLLTDGGTFRKAVDKRLGFPADRKREKAQILELIGSLAAVPGLEITLAAVRGLPPARYPEADWQMVRACFTLLRQAAGELKIVFAEAGAVDYIEVAQIAQQVLTGPDGLPTDAALAISDQIRHLLVDEFQDTSRRQHQLLSSLIAAWPERTGRTGFVVGDPMQSIYFFRDADAELFPRVKDNGLEIAHDEPLLFDSVRLSANFRTAHPLVERLNEVFGRVFAEDDGSGVTFSPAEPARDETSALHSDLRLALHLEFVPQASRGAAADPGATNGSESAREVQVEQIVALIQCHQGSIDAARQAIEREEDKKFRIAVLGRAKKHLAPIAAALREAGIPFRAVDLEKLAARPEVLDALALAQALLNPQARVAWLGVLRAPWCGLSPADLHTLAGDAESATRPIPELLAERLPLLSEEGRPAAARVLQAAAAAPALRAAQPAARLGTWLEQVWLLLGGKACADPAARANLTLLWGCLDRLPGGEQDLLGPALNAALDQLTALPNPEASSDCGVQLMTIHKSKGLEFEVVIVPELQAGGGRGERKMLSWLERGLAQPGDSGEITEFLIAPLQSKGADSGKAKQWVDRVYRERESQEMRRILYVAATRAREELHLFARPACKKDKEDSWVLAEPSNSLLATAWPALEEEVRACFDAWKDAFAVNEPEEQSSTLDSIAASGENNLLVLPTPLRPTLLRRLPPDYRRAQVETVSQTAAESPALAQTLDGFEPQTALRLISADSQSLYARHEGGHLSRALGNAVHTLLEKLARLRTSCDWESAREALESFEPRVAAQVRSTGVDSGSAARIAAEAMRLALQASNDPNGAWILSPHAGAASEAGWAGVIAGALRTVRPDRVFQAGPTPQTEGDSCWWIVDYKTAHAGGADPAAELPGLRGMFRSQLEAYAEVLRRLHGDSKPLRAGLYYPRMSLLDWWEM
jgi:ATP-dependent exoDNAse (exonuclease V) beta subunit